MVVNCGLIETSLERCTQNKNLEVRNMLHCKQMNAFALYTSQSRLHFKTGRNRAAEMEPTLGVNTLSDR